MPRKCLFKKSNGETCQNSVKDSYCYRHIRNTKPSFWVILSVILCTSVMIIGFIFLNNLYITNFPNPVFTYNANQLINVSYNVINLYNKEYTLKGDQICFKLKLENNKDKNMGVFIDYEVQKPNGNKENNTDTIKFVLLANQTRENDICHKFIDTGFHLFAYYLKLQPDDILIPVEGRTVGFMVYTESEYLDLTTRRQMIWIFLLATIPIILSTIKTFRDLYRNK